MKCVCCNYIYIYTHNWWSFNKLSKDAFCCYIREQRRSAAKICRNITLLKVSSCKSLVFSFPCIHSETWQNLDFYCNHHHFSVPKNCCYRHPCNPALHTQLVEYSKNLLICIQRMPGGNLVSTIACNTSLTIRNLKVFKFKKEYKFIT